MPHLPMNIVLIMSIYTKEQSETGVNFDYFDRQLPLNT